MSFIDAVGSAFMNYFNFRDRASRSQYWWFALFQLLLGICTLVIDHTVFSAGPDSVGPVNLTASVITLAPTLAIGVRRLHDVGRSGWWLLLAFTIVGIVPLIYWACQPSDQLENAYGPQPN